MKRRHYVAFGAAALVVLAHLAMRAFGLGVHTSAVAGMPVDDSSVFIAPIYIGVYLLAATLAPILAIATVLDLLADALLQSRHSGGARSAAGNPRPLPGPGPAHERG